MLKFFSVMIVFITNVDISGHENLFNLKETIPAQFLKCSEHYRDCSRMKEPFLKIYHFYKRIKKNYASLRGNFSLRDGNRS